MSTPRQEQEAYWRQICQNATDRELQDLWKMHTSDPHRMFEGPRGERIKWEMESRASSKAGSSMESIAQSVLKRIGKRDDE